MEKDILTMIHHLNTIRMAAVKKKQKITSVSKAVVKVEFMYNSKWCGHYEKQHGNCSKN